MALLPKVKKQLSRYAASGTISDVFFTIYSTDGAVASLQYLHAPGIAEKHCKISATPLTKVLTLLQTRLCAYH
jgi:hypothetical protein